MKFAKAYNFLYSWQLIPEKCDYQHGVPPKSSIYKMEGNEDDSITISLSWLTHDNQSFKTAYKLVPDGELHPFEHPEVAASIRGEFSGSHTFTVTATNGDQLVWQVVKEIQPNGYMKLTQTGVDETGRAWINTQYYHKQLSVLPYASSVSGAVIKPTEEGMIKHKALTAMEEQTNMQLEQIRKQIELLAVQAHAIQKRRELSLMIYEASLKFKPNIGQVYHLYEKQDGSFILSLVSPGEWGGAGPFKEFVSSVKLLADHTWVEI